MNKKSIISISVEKYNQLKKNGFSDQQIRKIVHIILACATDESHWP